mgnify:CR=1 FL=1
MAWIYLVIAGLLEVGWAVGLKHTDGFTRLVPSILTGSAMVASIFLLAVAVRTLPIGTAYAVWTGIGTVGAVAYGIFFAGEPTDALRIGAITLIVVGIVGLKLVSPH